MVNNRWARLSQNEKAELLGIYTKYGYNDLAKIIADYNTYADGGPEDVEKPSLKKRVAYRLGSAAKEGAGLTITGIFEALVSPQKEYDELDAYLNGADKHFEKYNGKSNGPIVGKKWEGIPQYKAKINPNGEYLFPEEWRNIIDLAAQNGTTIYQNADKAFEYSPEYRFDAANYPMIIGRSDNGYVVNSADLYDFDKDYADRYTEKNKPLKRALVKAEIGMMRGAGNPYIVREEGIPIRFIGNDASQEEKDLAHQTILGIGKGETGNEFDENTAIDKILNRMGLYTGASSEIIEEMPDYLRYGSGGKIHIKPENRGKFTALKKRTGHSASWFKAHGTPAQKKMAVFALNARKWKHEDGGPLANYLDDGGPYGVIPLGGDYLTYLQTIPEVSGGAIKPSVVTAALPSKFNGSQAAAARYAEGYQKGAKPVTQAMNRAGQDIFNTVDTVVGLTPTPAGAISWLGHMGADAAEGEYGEVAKDAVLAAAMGLGLGALGRGYTYLRNYVDDATNFGEDIFRAFTDRVPGRVSTNFTYAAPATRTTMEAVPSVSKAVSAPYEIENLGGGYMLKSLMRGNPLEKQISKNGTVNVNNARALVGKGSKVEQAVVNKVLASEEFAGKKSIDYNKFRRAVQDELITYERTPDTRWDNYGIDRLRIGSYLDAAESPEMRNRFNEFVENNFAYDPNYELFSIPGDPSSSPLDPEDLARMFFEDGPGFLDTPVGVTKELNTFAFSSPRIPNGSAKHYNPNTLGHSRTYTTTDEPDVLHVMESQSDWAQGYDTELRGINSRIKSIEERIAQYKKDLQNGTDINGEELGDRVGDWEEQLEDDVRQLKLVNKWRDRVLSRQNPQTDYLADNYTSRQIQENLRYAAEKGQTKMRYPTRETVAKIEGYGRGEAYFNNKGEDITTSGESFYELPREHQNRYDELEDKIRSILKTDEPNGSVAYNSDGVTYWHTPETLEKVGKLDMQKNELLQNESILKPGITKKDVFTANGDYKTAEMILQKYDAFPKQFRKLYKNTDVRTVTDPKGNTWYEVDVPKGYLQQEWAYKNGGQLKQFADISSIF